jgi:PAS domain S-box-containing protein
MNHMVTPSENRDSLYFLSGGGEMGQLIRDTDWSKTPLGEPESWPQSLRTTVGIMLNNPFGMYIAWGKDYTQIYNDSYKPILGVNKHPRALGISTRETFSEVWHIIGDMFDGVMQGKAVGFPDFMLPLNRDGFVEECYFDFSYSPILKNNGKVGGVLVTVIETTTKKKAQDALKESEERFRAMADNIPNLAWMADSAGSLFWYNKKWYEFTGTNYEQMQGWGWQSVHDPEKLPSVISKWQESIATGKAFEMVFPLRGANGQFRQFLTRVLPVFDPQGHISQWFGTNTDITEQIEIEEKLKKSEEQLKESEQNLRNTILQAPVAMCIFKGPKHVLELANELMFTIWGKPAEELMGKPIFEGLPEAKNQGFEELLDGVFKTGKTFSVQGAPVTLPRNGSTEIVYITFVYEAYREAKGTISGVIAVALDVTAQVLARHSIEMVVTARTKELEIANKDLQKSNEELAQFAYIASHDLQEPLRKIGIYTQLLEDSIRNYLDEKSKNYIFKIQTSTFRMTSLIRDVLNYSELIKDAEGFEAVDLTAVVKAVCTDFELLIEKKYAVIQSSGLPTIKAIPLQMAQLFGNLIGNSLKYSREDVSPSITISAFELDETERKKYQIDQLKRYVLIQIKDNGIGFKEEHAEKIFHIFKRLHGKADYEGTGIGLAMCKKIALNHHGDINAVGSSENGAVFNVLLQM